jgi:hypothetical protein
VINNDTNLESVMNNDRILSGLCRTNTGVWSGLSPVQILSRIYLAAMYMLNLYSVFKGTVA